MTLPRAFLFVAILLFGGIAPAAYFKKQQKNEVAASLPVTQVVEENIPIEIDLCSLQPVEAPPSSKQEVSKEELSKEDLPEEDRIELLFQRDSPLPIVE